MQAFLLRGKDTRCVEKFDSIGRELPASLVIPPGEYLVGGTTWRLTEEGLYRFLDPLAGSHQHIVYAGDVLTLMASFSWLMSHGYRDNRKPFSDLESMARREKIIVTCGDCAAFAVELFARLQVSIRLVRGRTLQPPNGYNDGHILTEVKMDGSWVAFDPDMGNLYFHHGKILNFLELVVQLPKGEVEARALTQKIPLAIGHYSSEGHHFDLWMETRLAHPDWMRELLARPLGIPIIAEDGKSYFTTFEESQRRQAQQFEASEGLVHLPQPEFMEKFYGRAFCSSILKSFSADRVNSIR